MTAGAAPEYHIPVSRAETYPPTQNPLHKLVQDRVNQAIKNGWVRERPQRIDDADPAEFEAYVDSYRVGQASYGLGAPLDTYDPVKHRGTYQVVYTAAENDIHENLLLVSVNTAEGQIEVQVTPAFATLTGLVFDDRYMTNDGNYFQFQTDNYWKLPEDVQGYIYNQVHRACWGTNAYGVVTNE